MHTFYALVILLFLVGCASNRINEYPFKGFPLEEIGLSCSNNEALKIAREAALKKYPELKGKLRRYDFTNFTFSLNGENEKYPYEYYLKSVFVYYPIGRPETTGFFEETLTVLLTKECEVTEVQYSKGVVQVII